MHMHFGSDITLRENLSTLTFSQLILFAISKQHLEEVVYYVVFTLLWWIGKDSLGIVHDVSYCYNLGKKGVPPY